jgi:hypothetical protein
MMPVGPRVRKFSGRGRIMEADKKMKIQRKTIITKGLENPKTTLIWNDNIRMDIKEVNIRVNLRQGWTFL